MNLSDESLKYLNLCLNTRCNLCKDECPEYNKDRMEFNSPRGKLELIYESVNYRLDAMVIKNFVSCCEKCNPCVDSCPAEVKISKILSEFVNLK